MKRCILLLLIAVFCLSACAKKEKDLTAPELTLNKVRIQVNKDAKIDYASYIEKAEDQVDGDLKGKVTYNSIDTSKYGQYEVKYIVKDLSGNVSQATLIVDVVKYFDEDIFSPLEVETTVVEHPEDITVLVNKLNVIPDGWKPDDLEPVVDSQYRYLRKEANEAYTKFYKECQKRNIAIYSISAYRECETQELYWNNQVEVYGEEYASQYSAYPNRSEHQLGLAIDVSYTTEGDRLSESVADSDLGKFIVSDGYKYGFILRYPKDKVAITNYGYEPWHMRYVGVELATQLHDSGLTLEEYYKQ